MIEKMNLHYSFTNPASIHDEEALTALELAGRQGAKINEVVEAQNNLRTETENHLGHQDSKIEKIRVETVPSDVKKEVQKQIDNGTFDHQIGVYANDLETRVDNLLGMVEEGTTTGDAELIDLRLDVNGITHATAGESVRNSFRHAFKISEYANIGKNVVPVDWVSGIIDMTNGNFAESATRICCTHYHAVPTHEITASAGNGYKWVIAKYKWNGSSFVFLGATEWNTGTISFKLPDECTHIRFMVGAVNDDAITPAHGVNFAAMFDSAKVGELSEKVNKNNGVTARFTTTHNYPNAAFADDNAIEAATTKRWFLEEVIPSASYIRKLTFLTRWATNVVIELWDYDGSTLRRVKEINARGMTSGTHTVDVNHYTLSPTMVSVKSSEQSLRIVSGIDDIKTLAHSDLTGTEIPASGLSPFYGYRLCCNLVYDTYSIKNNNPLIITVGDGEMYSEIQPAIESITDTENHYIIKVTGRKTPYKRFSMVRKLDEGYNFTGGVVRNISIIGDDPALCVVLSDEGAYYSPAVEPLCNGVIKNMTFISTHENQDTSATQGGYAAHIDCAPADNAGYKMRFVNCVFKSDNAPAVGIGLHENTNLSFDHCEFYGTATETYSPFTGYRNLATHGSFFAHTSSDANVENQRLTLDSCKVYTNESPMALWLGVTSGYTGGSIHDCVATIYNTYCYNLGGGARAKVDGEFIVDGKSFGNNASVLNKCAVE